MDGCKNNLAKSSTTKLGEHIPSGFSVSTILSFKDREMNMIYAEVKFVWKSCGCLKKHTRKIINIKKKENEVINK